MFYALDTNFRGLTGPALASMLPVPQRYYVPSRIRECHRPRLEASGLWILSDGEKSMDEKGKEKQQSIKDTLAHLLEKERVGALLCSEESIRCHKRFM